MMSPIAAETVAARHLYVARLIGLYCMEMSNQPPYRAMTVAAADICTKLREAGLRPTRQRTVLGQLLFGHGDRHVTAERLHGEAIRAGEKVSLATVYNTLHQFCSAGLLRELAIDGTRAYFDTNTSNHNHFFVEPDGELLDIPSDTIRVNGLPTPPEGMAISHIDVVVRLVRK
jgi:Fur family transcriptional regulator, iron response regulator